MSIGRRHVLLGTGASVLAASGRIPRLGAQTASSIRLPVVLPASGPMAPYSETCRMGSELAADYINSRGGILGRRLEIQILDDMGKPEQTVARVRELISDGHRIFVGGLLTASSLAVFPLLSEAKTVFLMMGATGMPITHDHFTRNMFHCTANEYEREVASAKLVADRFPNALNWGAILTDAATYRDTYANFGKLTTKAYAEKGLAVKFNEPTVAKYGSTDFRTQIAQLAEMKVDAIVNEFVGTDCITFWQQSRALELGKNLKGALDFGSIDFSTAQQLRTSLPPNLWTVVTWYSGLYSDNPLSESLAEGFTRRTGGKYPSPYLSYGHLPVLVFAEAMKKTNGSNDSEMLIKAIEMAKVETELGTVYFRPEDHQIIADVDFVNMLPQQDDPGFRVAGAVKMAGKDLIEPAGPGAPFKM